MLASKIGPGMDALSVLKTHTFALKSFQPLQYSLEDELISR
jgi:hypothetical protein